MISGVTSVHVDVGTVYVDAQLPLSVMALATSSKD